MDIRIKLNKKVRSAPKYATKSSLYTTFNEEFNYFIDSSDSYSYVSRPNMELQLKECIIDSNNSFTFLTGLTGAGKSTLIKHVLDAQAAPNIIKFYISLNNADISDRDSFIRRFTAIIANAINIYTNTLDSEIQKEVFSLDGFKNFIFHHKRYAELAAESYFPKKDKLDEAIYDIFKNNSHEFRNFPILIILWLQYLLFCNNNKTRCLLIVDNIEGISENLQPEIFNYFVTVYSGLITEVKEHLLKQNRLNIYSVAALFPVRPDTLNYWKDRKGLALRVNIIRHNEIFLTSPPSLKDIFLKRFETIQEILSKQDSEKQKKREVYDNYQRVYNDILLPLLSKIDSICKNNSRDEDYSSNIEYSQIIIELANHNIREALEFLRVILVNGDFFNRVNSQSGAFGKIELKNFYPTNAGILLSLAIQTGEIYRGLEPVVNILKNDEPPETDLITLLLIRYIYFSIEDDNYFTPLSWKKIKRKILSLFNGIYSSSLFNHAFEVLMNRNVLLKTHDGNILDNKDWFILAPRGVILLDLLSSSSVLLQCYREDLYRSFDEMNFIQEFTNKMPRSSVYLDMISYLRYFMDSELTLLNLLKDTGNISKYIEHYGRRLMSEQLYCGVKIDFEIYFQKDTQKESLRKVFDQKKLLEEDINELCKTVFND